ncbi:alpha/beta hydrolase (plasmid) [Embleya sp. NBC_00888]|uniref:alpha/beta hydrolase n=1 Tax=Embleya sp. NBC_00888 TaxID=2975960 RepID=UPI002F912EB1|nr:alpha/beta hydrolase [Embleya sp. NBC_00888]
MRDSRLDSQAAEQLRQMAYFTVGGSGESLDAQRNTFKDMLSRISDEHLHRFDGTVSNTVVDNGTHTVPVRRYEPLGGTEGAGIVYFHGGGWVFGDLDTGDRFARSMARTLGVTVVSVDYRRAPEHAYPAALEDCVIVAERARDEFGTWCAVAGDSAGGNLATAASLCAHPGRGYDAQLLLYPCLDASMTGASFETYADGYGLTRDAMEYYWGAYRSRHPTTDPLLSPQAAESLHQLPPTILVTAGFDVLFDENQHFAQRLLSSGVSLTYLPFPSLPHGFIDLVDRVDAARQAVGRLLAALKSFVPDEPALRG